MYECIGKNVQFFCMGVCVCVCAFFGVCTDFFEQLKLILPKYDEIECYILYKVHRNVNEIDSSADILVFIMVLLLNFIGS